MLEASKGNLRCRLSNISSTVRLPINKPICNIASDVNKVTAMTYESLNDA